MIYEHLENLLKLMQRSLPFTGDRQYIRDLINLLIEKEVKSMSTSRIEEIERKINNITTKLGFQQRG